MKTIKKISGDLLLFLYYKQRQDVLLLLEILNFSRKNTGEIELARGSEFVKNIFEITNNSSIDIYNSFNYLKDKGFVFFNSTENTGGYLIHALKVSAGGIDIIEGIERGQKEKSDFTVNFNIKLADKINIKSLLKAELGSLFKASLI